MLNQSDFFENLLYPLQGGRSLLSLSIAPIARMTLRRNTRFTSSFLTGPKA